ncbi:Sensor histidine kinase DcuS [Pelotomaculum sp. FP]|uniref:sensor histidine kinase n=1 Tax=Pelotomaculum sp. FP TaxID=261474 RepID=UPI0010662889|nr:GHKL domain-containing protein [Pelotomaculum sp. FP]TEB10363.1 Sensor histidine kinase DcuS [Pelotomaculum sp. FP]
MNTIFAKKPIEKLVIILLSEVLLLLIISMILDYYRMKIDIQDVFIAFIAVTNFAISIYVIRWLLYNNILQKEMENQSKKNLILADAMNLIRAERHDHINHLQVLYGLIYDKQVSEAHEYLDNLNANYRFNTQLINIPHPTLRSLLQIKRSIAESKGIIFKLNVESQLDKFKMSQTAITSVFGNILDNAIEAVNNLGPEFLREIKFESGETQDSYFFVISDSGPAIENEILKNIFKEGFSTKGKNRGYGLFTVKKIINSYRGKIYHNGAGFNIVIPKD